MSGHSRLAPNYKYDIAIVGGLGHVGLPLGIMFADAGQKVCLLDLSKEKADEVKKGIMPFIEYGADEILHRVLKAGTLETSLDKSVLAHARYIIIAIGTPVDEFLNPKTRQFLEFFDGINQYLTDEQTIIIRSTVYPRTCEQIAARILPKKTKISYCPERIVQGYAIKELKTLPQVVAGITPEAQEDGAKLFSILAPKIIKTSMGEAELVKLFSNAWRYVQFAVANQFYMMSNNFGVEYEKVRAAMRDGYERNHSVPGAGFAAGPCLLKDTMQLAAFNGNNFMLGHAAMLVNEGLPHYVVEEVKKKHDLKKVSVGILGMAFKGDIDDIRDSLSFKLGKILRFNGTHVNYSDEFAKNPDFVSKEELIKKSDVIIVAVPHSAYKGLVIPKGKTVIDLWHIVKHE